MKTNLPLLLAGFIATGAGARAQTNSAVVPQEVQGKYFASPRYVPHPLPQFAELRDQLPAPIYEERSEWVAMYWKAWELAFRNFHEPAPGSGYVSQFIDAAFNQNIFLWDTCFMTMFCNYAHPLTPGIGSLDNFYAKQHADGEICREIGRADGVDFAAWQDKEGQGLFSRWGWNGVAGPVVYKRRAVPQPPPRLTLDALNHPILGWAELESYQVTGDRGRIERVYEPLVRYYRALQKYLRQGNGLYMTDWASMDNSPRNPYLKNGGTGIDISSQMVLFARNLDTMSTLLGKATGIPSFAQDAAELSHLINRHMWDPGRQFYFDLTLEGQRAPIKTVAGFWPLLAQVASPAQGRTLVKELSNPDSFGRMHRVPTLSADSSGYDSKGGYWRGAVWAPTDTMVIRGLENYGYRELARQIVLNHMEMLGKVFQQTGTIWENYAPDAVAPGHPAKKDFVGWSGIGPIMYLLEYAVGLQANAPKNKLTWDLRSDQRVGCERFRFNGHLVTLAAKPADGRGRQISITSDGGFRLQVKRHGTSKVIEVHAGEQQFTLR